MTRETRDKQREKERHNDPEPKQNEQEPKQPSNYILCPFRVAVDSSEQMPWSFHGIHTDKKDKNRPLVIETEKTNLETGDYSIVGLEPLLTIERKSIPDFYGTILGDRERFERELERMQAMAERKLQFCGLCGADWLSAGKACSCGAVVSVESRGYAEVVCEGDWYSHPFTRPDDEPGAASKRLKTVYRTVLAWKQRYPLVHWERFPSRRDAERYAFRVLERFWRVREEAIGQARKLAKKAAKEAEPRLFN